MRRRSPPGCGVKESGVWEGKRRMPGKPSGISSSGALSPPKTCVSRHDATLLCDDCDPLPGADDGIVRRWLGGGEEVGGLLKRKERGVAKGWRRRPALLLRRSGLWRKKRESEKGKWEKKGKRQKVWVIRKSMS